MHLIPQNLSHLHILVAVFPTVGLIFVIGFYVAGMIAGSETIKRTGLFAFGVLALLAGVAWYSGNGAADALTQNSKIPQDLVDAHYGWSVAALSALGVTGLFAWINLLRFGGAKGRQTDNALHLVLGLALISLALMVVVGELGWEMNRDALALDPTKLKTPAAWANVHMILNHFPTVGFVVALGVYILALIVKSDVMKRTGLVLFVICVILTIPTFVTGNAAMWTLTDPLATGISKAAINAHRDMALLTLFGCGFTGVTAWIELWRYRHLGRFSGFSLTAVLVFAIVTLGLMAETGHRGGQINHAEIRTEALPTDPNAYWSPAIETQINQVIWFVPWQTVHFFGYALVFGVAFAVSLRVLGFWKSVPFSALHRILPLGVFGVTMNIFSGMLILQADSSRYLNEITFVPKVFFITIGAMAVLYYSISDSLWNVKAGEEAPMTAKWVAALVLVSWTGVIMGGRLLPYV